MMEFACGWSSSSSLEHREVYTEKKSIHSTFIPKIEGEFEGSSLESMVGMLTSVAKIEDEN